MSLVREFALVFLPWTVPTMTTAEARATAVVPVRRVQRPWGRPKDRMLSLAGLAAVVVGSQTLAASSPQASAVRLLLPS